MPQTHFWKQQIGQCMRNCPPLWTISSWAPVTVQISAFSSFSLSPLFSPILCLWMQALFKPNSNWKAKLPRSSEKVQVITWPVFWSQIKNPDSFRVLPDIWATIQMPEAFTVSGNNLNKTVLRNNVPRLFVYMPKPCSYIRTLHFRDKN